MRVGQRWPKLGWGHTTKPRQSTQKVAEGLGRVLKLAMETPHGSYEPSSGEMTSVLTNQLVVSRLKQTAGEQGSCLGNSALVGGQFSDIEICHVDSTGALPISPDVGTSRLTVIEVIQ